MVSKVELPVLDFTKLTNENYIDYFIKETSEDKDNIETGTKDLSLQKEAVIEYKIFENMIEKNNKNYDCNKIVIIVFSFLFCISIMIGIFCFIIYF